jgi:flagellar protein FliL
MAKKNKKTDAAGVDDESTDAGDGGGKGRGGKMMPAAMISIALVAAGYFVGGRGGSAPAAEAAPATTVAHEPEVETIVDLEAVNVNLADGHYLRVAISIGMAAHHGEEGEAKGGGHGKAGAAPTTEPTAPTAPAADLVLSTFSGKTMAELSTLDGRVAAREHLLEELKEFYGEDVITVFFTEFVMQ